MGRYICVRTWNTYPCKPNRPTMLVLNYEVEHKEDMELNFGVW